MKTIRLFQKVLVVWLVPSIGLYFLHADSAILSHSLWEHLEKTGCGGCQPPHNFVCLTRQFACIQYKAENSSTWKTGDAELSLKPNFEIFACCEGALFDYFVCLCTYFWRKMSCPLFYFIMKTELLLRSPRVWDGLLFGFLKENKIN